MFNVHSLNMSTGNEHKFNQDALWGGRFGTPRQPCIGLGPDPPTEIGHFWGGKEWGGIM